MDRLELLVEGNQAEKHQGGELARRLKQETLLTFDRIEVVEKLKDGPQVVDQRERRTF